MADIIVVDDEPELREMLAEALGVAGHAVCYAADDGDLRRLVAERPPALVLWTSASRARTGCGWPAGCGSTTNPPRWS